MMFPGGVETETEMGELYNCKYSYTIIQLYICLVITEKLLRLLNICVLKRNNIKY